MKVRILWFFTLICSCAVTSAQPAELPSKIDIRVFTNSVISEISLTSLEGVYFLYTDKQSEDELISLKKFSSLKLRVENDKIEVIRRDTVVFASPTLYVTGHGFNTIMLLNPKEPNLAFRIYDDDFLISVENGGLKIINNVALEKYVAGVVQSESGFLRHNVYYQVQATIARTYALKNINRHQSEGFNLCEQVHCQAYYGRTGYNPIIEAVDFSRGSVIIDNNYGPVNTVYHANCGGQTINSEDLWPQALPYLRSVQDTFCLSSPGSQWEMKISADEFFNYIETRFRLKPSEQDKETILAFSQNSRKHFLDTNESIQLRLIREQFRLRSTFFSIEAENDTLIFAGRGFGHGVGLCQEGAMRMAELGYTKNQILNYYYHMVKIVVLDEIN